MTLSDEPTAAASAQVAISSAVRVLKKHPQVPGRLRPDAEDSTRDVSALRSMLQRLQAKVRLHQMALQKPALERIFDAVNTSAPFGQFPAVCVDMGTSSVSGDSSTFDTIVAHLSDRLSNAVVRTIHPTRHDSLRVLADALHTPSPDVRLVVAVEHAHLFHPDLLSDLVYLLYHKAHQTPNSHSRRHPVTRTSAPLRNTPSHVAAVFALPHANALHEALNVRDAATLCTTLVRMPVQSDMLNAFVETFSTRPGVLFTASIFNMIERHFYTHDMSLAMLLRTMRQVVTLHYVSNPLAPLIDSIDSLFDQSPKLRTASNATLVCAFQNPALLTVAKTFPSASELDPKDPSSFVAACKRLACWKQIANALQVLASRLDSVCHNALERNIQPCAPSPVQSDSRRVAIFRALLPTNSPGTSATDRLCENLCNRARKLTRERLREFFTALAEELEDFPSPSPPPDVHDLPTLLEQTQELLALFSQRPSAENSDAASIDKRKRPSQENEPQQPKPQTPLKRATGGNAALLHRRQQLASNMQQTRQKDPFNQARDKLSPLLKHVFDLCPPLQTLPLHEILLYSNSIELSRAAGGLEGGAEPRTAIFTALRQPSQTLDVDQPFKLPDIVVAFRLLAEGGRLVSLYDWFNSFAMARTAANMASHSSDDGTKTVISPAEMQARFSRACSELEFIGVLKYTNRKTDHVARLAFE